MILDLNALTVESFETDGAAALRNRGGPTREVILCAAEQDGADLMAPTYPYPSCGCVDP
jgi:hypothetical protein